MDQRHRWSALVLIVAVLAIGLAAGFLAGSSKARGKPAPAVTITRTVPASPSVIPVVTGNG